MLFRRATLDGIASGDITLAFRRWRRPTAKAGGRVRTVAGVVRIGEISVCAAASLSEADATASGFSSLAALQAMLGPDDRTPVYRIELAGIEPDERVELRQQAEPTGADWAKIDAAFARWERATPGYFPSILKLIHDRPGIAAGSLAAELGAEKLKFKQDVRKLKAFGLTESLDIGYRLSPRGEVVSTWLRRHRA